MSIIYSVEEKRKKKLDENKSHPFVCIIISIVKCNHEADLRSARVVRGRVKDRRNQNGLWPSILMKVR
jgi:hypothetical protein